MKTAKMHKAAALVFACLCLANCNMESINKDQTKIEKVTLKNDSMNYEEMKAELKEQYNIAIAKMAKEIDVLEAKWQRANQEGKKDLEESIYDLKNERKALEQKLEEIEKTMASSWQDWQVKANNVLKKAEEKTDSIKQSIKDSVATW